MDVLFWLDDLFNDGPHPAPDLTAITIEPGSNGCTVLTGTLDDTYTATAIAFTRGEDTSRAVRIDHVLALSDAWQKGAQQLDEQTRRHLANDPLNLQALFHTELDPRGAVEQ